jgi:predicted protein tyrosine phosphatase
LWQLEDNFLGHNELLTQIEQKQIVLNIPDNFEYMDPELQQMLHDELFVPYGPVTTK